MRWFDAEIFGVRFNIPEAWLANGVHHTLSGGSESEEWITCHLLEMPPFAQKEGSILKQIEQDIDSLQEEEDDLSQEDEDKVTDEEGTAEEDDHEEDADESDDHVLLAVSTFLSRDVVLQPIDKRENSANDGEAAKTEEQADADLFGILPNVEKIKEGGAQIVFVRSGEEHITWKIPHFVSSSENVLCFGVCIGQGSGDGEFSKAKDLLFGLGKSLEHKKSFPSGVKKRESEQ